MDEDEDIIFEGHPLYHHLQETCHQEFEYVPKKLIENDKHLISLENTPYEGLICTLLKTLLEKSNTIFSSKELVADHLKLTSLKLLQHGVLPEDVAVLENLSSLNEILLHQNYQERNDLKDDLLKKYEWNWKNNVLLLDLGILCSLLMILWFLSTIYVNICALLLFALLAVFGLRLFSRWKFSQIQCRIDSFVELSHNVFKSCSKSQKILNEIDFLGKENNLKFITSTHNALYAAQEEVSETFTTYITQGHGKLKQMGVHLNFSTISSLYDDRFSSDATAFVKVSSHTALSDIKVKREILSQQYSAFVTAFILLTEVAWNRRCIGWSPEPTSIFCDARLLRTKGRMELLNKCIALANRAWFPTDHNEAVADRNGKLANKAGKLAHSRRVANSLSTHAKSFLATFYHFEELLWSAGDPAMAGLVEDEDFTAEIDQMATELESCSGCLDEIKTILAAETLLPAAPPASLEPAARVDVTQNPTIGGADPIIVDEVFELYVAACDHAVTGDSAWSDDPIESRDTMKVQKTHCKSVLKEMQPILRKRRTMWERREEIALKRSAAGDSVSAHEDVRADPDDANRNTGCSDEDEEVETQNIDSLSDTNDNLLCDERYTSPIDGEHNTNRTERTFEGDGVSDEFAALPRPPLSLEERVASWNGTVGLGLMSVLTGAGGTRPRLGSEETFDAVGEQESDSESDSSSTSS